MMFDLSLISERVVQCQGYQGHDQFQHVRRSRSNVFCLKHSIFMCYGTSLKTILQDQHGPVSDDLSKDTQNGRI